MGLLPLGSPGGSDNKESTCNAGNPGLIPGSGRSPGEENGNSLQYSCLENSMDRRAWWATDSDRTERLSRHTRISAFIPHHLAQKFLPGMTLSFKVGFFTTSLFVLWVSLLVQSRSFPVLNSPQWFLTIYTSQPYGYCQCMSVVLKL